MPLVSEWKMDDRKTNLQKYAMQYGTYMGLYWIFKFAFFPLGLKMPFLELLFMVLTLAVPVWGYIGVRRFRNKYCGGCLSFGQAFVFCFMMYMFASILTAVGHYIYFRYIDNGYLCDTYDQLLRQFGKIEGMTALAEQMDTALNTFRQLSPIRITMQFVSQNMFYGCLMALPTALLAMRRKAAPF